MAKITGSDIRRYRKELDLTQSEFVKQMGITQAALSLIEKGKTAVADSHLEKLRANFTAPPYALSFAAYERRLDAEREKVLAGKAALGDHLTVVAWRWDEAGDLTDGFRADQAADLLTIRKPAGRVLALVLPAGSEHWAPGEIAVFEECSASDLAHGDLCLIHYRTPRAADYRTAVAVAHVLPAGRGHTIQIQPVSPPGRVFEMSADLVHNLLKARFRGRYLEA
jgi:transcriptional regulator with XRE-family HTH domain